MSVYADVEEFIHDHRPCGTLTATVTEPTPNGYGITIACSCGVVFERWVLTQDAAEDLVRACLLAREN
jgi:hypothetical protein